MDRAPIMGARSQKPGQDCVRSARCARQNNNEIAKYQPLIQNRAMQTPLKKHPQMTVAEFFAGIGLMRIGLDQAGWTTMFANDIDEKKWEMYRDHFGDCGEFHIGDIHALDTDIVPSVALA